MFGGGVNAGMRPAQGLFDPLGRWKPETWKCCVHVPDAGTSGPELHQDLRGQLRKGAHFFDCLLVSDRPRKSTPTVLA